MDAEVSKLGTVGLNFHGASARNSSFVMRSCSTEMDKCRSQMNLEHNDSKHINLETRTTPHTQCGEWLLLYSSTRVAASGFLRGLNKSGCRYKVRVLAPAENFILIQRLWGSEA